MAQYDTGMGWSAKDTWLMSASGLLCNAGGLISTDQLVELPVISPNEVSGQTLYDRGLKVNIAIDEPGGGLTYWKTWAAAPAPGVYVYAVGAYPNIYAISATQNQEYYVAQTTSTVNPPSSYSIRSCSTAVAVTGGNAYKDYIIQGIPSSIVPLYSTEADFINTLSVVNATISKLNSGLAVACIAKWRTAANVVKISPILISTESEFTDMSTTGTYQFAKYRTRRDGMTFYMSFYQDISGTLTSSALQVYDISDPEDPYANLDELFDLLCAPDQANVVVGETIDPYEDFGHTDEDGGEPDPDPEDDDIEETGLPTMSFATAGFCRIYRPSFSQVSALASYMWTDNNFLQTVINHLKQILENPIDAIISLSIVPCVPSVLADEEVKVMYVPTGVYMPPVQRQFVSVDCGTYTLKEMYGSALDYNPYTSVQLYLPYVGIVQLDTDEVMGKTLSIGYRIDVVTGVCCAYVKAGADVLYQFSGHCSIQQPITSADFSGYINAALAAGKLVASIAAAGAGAPAVAATLANAPTPSISGSESKTVETERNPNTGRQITVGTRKRESQTFNPGASFGEIATRGVSNTVGAVMNSKTIVQHSGGFSGNSGFMAAVRRPYLIVTRPRIANPANYGKYNGRPSMIYLNLSDCTGFTQVQSIQLTGIDATNPELSEIATLLNSGVIL